ncbi:MAG: DUF5686 family protein [Bacteroidota bacterium]
MCRHLLPFVLLGILAEVSSSQTFTISGTVRDASTREALAAATIRVVGKSTGTIANAQGTFRLSLEAGDYRLVFSYIGYRSDTANVHLDGSKEWHALLQPSAIQMAEVVISGEDPAMKIMRQVIENKHRWMNGLKSYQYDAFSRMVMRRDTAIAMIAETYSAGYWQQGDTLREIIKQRRQTENIPMAQNLVSVGAIVNFYQDEIRFTGFTFTGPTSPEAFDYYSFTLENTRKVDDKNVFTIRMTPKSRLTPLFRGTLNVIDEDFALVGVNVEPNEAYVMPFVSDLKISYAQQFSLFENRFWMPVDIRLTGSASISFAGVTIPPIGIQSISSIYDYSINHELPDSIFKKPRRVVAPEASKFDSAFWAQREVLPLTKEEQVAYKTIDSTQTLEKQFQPGGPLATIGSALSTLQYATVRFDRIEGLFLGANVNVDSVSNSVRLHGNAGYGFSDHRGKWRLGGELFLDETRHTSVGIEAYRGINHIPDEDFALDLGNTVSALFDKNDYRDYYYADGWKVTLKTRPFVKFLTTFSFQREDHSTAVQQTNYSFFRRDRPYRANPSINEGFLQSVSLSLRWGNDPVLLGLIQTDFAELELEHANRDWLVSTFDFSRMVFRGEYRIRTMLRNLFFPPALSIRMTAGTAFGSLPAQRYFLLDSRSSGYAPFGVLRGANIKEFGGDQFVVLSLEHNFRSTPFLALDIPFLYKNGIELVVAGTFAQSWNTHVAALPLARSTDGWYTEAGVGLSRIFGLFRIDLTRRFTPPSNYFFTVGVASIF